MVTIREPNGTKGRASTSINRVGARAYLDDSLRTEGSDGSRPV